MIILNNYIFIYKIMKHILYECFRHLNVFITTHSLEDNLMMREMPEENNRDIDELEMEDICMGCGTEESEWKDNKGRGYTKNGRVFCCKDCAEGIECTCGL
jgi:hypothetical protein